MKELEELDLLVHPGYSQFGIEDTTFHPVYEKIMRGWLERFKVRNKQDNYLAFYFSLCDLNKKQYPCEIKEEIEELNRHKAIVEADRIHQYKAILGNNLVILKSWAGPNYLPDQRRGWERLIRGHGFHFSADRLEVNSFGEIYEWCVDAWGISLAYTLGLKVKPQRIRRLSIDHIESTIFTEWEMEHARATAT